MMNPVGGERPLKDFGRGTSDLFFRKSRLVAVKKNDYILKSCINYNHGATFFLDSQASPR